MQLKIQTMVMTMRLWWEFYGCTSSMYHGLKPKTTINIRVSSAICRKHMGCEWREWVFGVI